MTKLIVTILICALLVSCKDKPTQPPATPNITGKWQGSGVKSGISYVVTANLSQNDGSMNVTGSGEISALLTKLTFSVEGTNKYPDVTLNFSNPDPQVGKGIYVGEFATGDDNTLDGKATVPAFGIIGKSLQLKRIR